MSRRNNVRGPTSALTEFLRESGINPATIGRRAATRDQAQAQTPGEGEGQGRNNGQNVEQSTTVGVEGEDERVEQDEDENAAAPMGSTSRSRPRPRAAANAGYVSDQLDEVEEEPPAKKRKGKGKGTAAKSRAKKKAKEDGDYEGSSEDEYTAVSRSLWSMGGNSGPKPPVGSFENCARCEKQFTVTKYTMAANPPPGYLCTPCTKASGIDPYKKLVTAKKRKPAEKREVIKFEERRVQTLAAMCIELIGKYINDVEALGDIGTVNMDEIAKTLARNRSLTPLNAQLFYDVQNERLRFYDATNLGPPALTTLASLNPNLTHLHLDYCGRLTCPVITAYSKSFPHLTHLRLLGPFLVRAEAWIAFFKAKPKLRSFRITQSPRFDLECMKSLAKHCTRLEELQLKEVGLLSDTFVEPICTLPPLKFLDLSYPGAGISEDGWLEVLERHGPTLETFDPSWHDGFTDLALENGLRKHARTVSELRLEGLSGLSDEGVANFFENWDKPFVATDTEDDECKIEVDDSELFTPNPPLHIVSLARNRAFSTATFTALLAHSASSLVSLDLNGLGPISQEALGRLKDVVNVRWLDMSWCRELDDFIMQDVLSSVSKLDEVRVWGCNRIKGTGWAIKRGMKVYGIEPNTGS